MKENAFVNQKIPSSMLIVFLEKALQIIHMETHVNDVSYFLRSKSFCADGG